MYYLVYLIRNLVNSKIYVGVHSAWNLDDGYLGSGQNIKRAIKKYGKENFERTILHYCYDEIQMYEWEKQIVNENFIRQNNTYNMRLGGNGGSLKGRKLSNESKIKMSKSHIGKPLSKYHISKISISQTGKPSHMLGHTHSEETKIKMTEWQLGRKFSEETKKKMSDRKKGNPLSNEHRKNLSIAKKGKPLSEEHKKNLRKPHKSKDNI
jgi:group I intron endonuclease